MSEGKETEVALEATDGRRLAATLLEPAPNARSGPAVVIAPATGTPRTFYLRFGRFLAGRGLPVVLFDWRGIGGSRDRPLAEEDADMRAWGERDLEGALRWARSRWPDRPLTLVGHSVGGQATGLAPTARELARLVFVTVQSGYWGHWGRVRGLPFALLMYVVMPGLARLLGFFPSSFLGLGEDLPEGVARQWARWCRDPEYMGDYEGHRRIAAPILALSFSDDPYATRGSVEWMNDRFTAAEVTHRHLDPAEAGADRVGHFGFFREGRTPALWEAAADFLAGAAPSGDAAATADGGSSSR